MKERFIYLLEKEKKSMDFVRKKGKIYMIMIDIGLFIVVMLIVFSAFCSIEAETTQERLSVPQVKTEQSFEKINKENNFDGKLSYEKAFYSEELAEELKQPIIEKVYAEAKKHYKNVRKEYLELAYDVCQNRINDKNPLTMKEFLNLFILNVSIMEVESNFIENIKGVNSTTTDHGIMQVNSSVIKTAEKELGRKLDVRNNLYDNIDTGSWEIFECYSKAEKNHPDNVLWWTYVYYNRGLFVENTKSWKTGAAYIQANERSRIFLETYNKYYNCMW